VTIAHKNLRIIGLSPASIDVSGGRPDFEASCAASPTPLRSLCRNFRLRPVQALAHFLAGLEEGDAFLLDGHMLPGPRVAASAGAAILHRKGPKATQLNAISPGERGDDLTQYCVHDILDIALVEVGILSRDALHEF
jgi:hypothetical protein